MKTSAERLDEFRSRMMAAPSCSSRAQAFELLATLLNAVENEFSGIPYDPSFPRGSGRMYPPQDDAHRSVPGRADLHRYRSQKHNTYFNESGAVLIVDLHKTIILEKPDVDGRSITL